MDILVELKEPTFDHYMDLKFYLEHILGRSVDLVLHDTIKPRLKTIIEPMHRDHRFSIFCVRKASWRQLIQINTFGK